MAAETHRRSESLPEAAPHSDYVSDQSNTDMAGLNSAESLPREILREILLQVPAQVLPVMRRVCREWDLVIRGKTFIHHHLQNATSGLIIKNTAHKWIYVEMRRGFLNIYNFDSGFDGVVNNSSNGLVLATDHRNPHDLYIVNPLTKKCGLLSAIFQAHDFDASYCHLVFVEARRQYKLVNTTGTCSPCNSKPRISVLTIGVDNVWRHISVEHIPLGERKKFLVPPTVTGSYMHWIGLSSVLTLNVKTETISHFFMVRLPNRVLREFLPMRNNLSVVCETNKFIRDVWEMNPETGMWTKSLSFDLNPVRHGFKFLLCEEDMESIIPYGWLLDREVLLFSTASWQKHCIAYNVKTGKIQSFELSSEEAHDFQPHVNNLAWLEGMIEV